MKFCSTEELVEDLLESGYLARDLGDDWHREAKCGGISDPDIFFPGRTQISIAQMLCSDCPVQLKCLADGVREEYGVWGGTSPKKRRDIRKELGLTRRPKRFVA